MASIQPYFIKFHDTIKLDDENDILREKRDILFEKLRKNLKEQVANPPSFATFNKGGYAMNLGVKPLNGDYDIDVGLNFDINRSDYPDPVVVKELVYNALKDHTDSVKIKNPCVTVQYHLRKEPLYHVDFAVYANDGSPTSLYLARGKPISSTNDRKWEGDDPKGLIKIVGEKFNDEDERLQFRRAIRSLKRWKDVKFSSNGHEAPIGISLTICAYHWFSISKVLTDRVKLSYEYKDLDATLNLVNAMLNRFYQVPSNNGEALFRLNAQLPVTPYNDLFEKMTDTQMTTFKEKLENLRDALEAARDEVDPYEACKILQKQFGDDFPVPEIKETAQRRAPAIVSSSSSA